MDQTLRTKIIEKLTEFLNRDPSEDEINNAQTDIIIMGKIHDDDIAVINEKLGLNLA